MDSETLNHNVHDIRRNPMGQFNWRGHRVTAMDIEVVGLPSQNIQKFPTNGAAKM
jgi:hypothetical protein